jgi:hypothetical protein
MKYYFAKHTNGQVTCCNWPVTETGADSYEFEVNEQDLKDVQGGDKEWRIEGGKLTVVASTKRLEFEAAQKAAEEAIVAADEAQKALKLELVQKITEGKASPEEQEAFVNLI